MTIREIFVDSILILYFILFNYILLYNIFYYICLVFYSFMPKSTQNTM